MSDREKHVFYTSTLKVNVAGPLEDIGVYWCITSEGQTVRYIFCRCHCGTLDMHADYFIAVHVQVILMVGSRTKSLHD